MELPHIPHISDAVENLREENSGKNTAIVGCSATHDFALDGAADSEKDSISEKNTEMTSETKVAATREAVDRSALKGKENVPIEPALMIG